MPLADEHPGTWNPLSAAASFLFEGVVRTRNRLYDSSLLPRRSLARPVISIGNLTVGGSGKTPLVIHVARLISRTGSTPVLLSRGYGRSCRHAVILKPGRDVHAQVELVGDEPALVKRHVPEAWLGISGDRYAVGFQILKQASGLVFILDDGFQHRRLRRNLDILVVDGTQPLERNRVLPAGTLREPWDGMRRADLLMINGLQEGRTEEWVENLVQTLQPDLPVFHARQYIDRLVPLSAWWKRSEAAGLSAEVRRAFLVAAVGNPERFRRDVQALGIEVRGTRFLRDHARMEDGVWQACAEEARRRDAEVLITTEKDAIKISGAPDFPLLVAVQATRLAEQDRFERMLGAIPESGN